MRTLWGGRRRLLHGLLLAFLATSLAGVYTKLPLNALLLQGAIFLLGLLWLLRGKPYAAASLRALSRSLGWPWGLFLLWALITTLTSQDRAASLQEVGLLASYALVTLLAADLSSSPSLRWRMVHICLLLGVLMSGIATYFFWGEAGNLPEPDMKGTFGNKNHLAGYLGLLLPLAIALYLQAPTRRLQLAYGATSLFLGTILLLTYSRGGWFSMVPALALVLWWLRPASGGWRPLASRFALLALLIALNGFLVAKAGVSHALGVGSQAVASVAQATLGAQPEGTLAPRLEYWRGSLQIMADYPLLGTGLGTFATLFAAYQQDPRYYSKFAHNFFLQSGAEMGLPGLLLSLGLLLGLALVGRRALQIHPPGGTPRALVAGLLGGMVASVLHNLVELDWYIPAIGFLFWAQVGLLAGLAAAPSSKGEAGPWPFRSGLWRALGAALAGGLLLGAALEWGSLSQVQQGLALRNQGRIEEAEAAFRLASTLNPLGTDPHLLLGELAFGRYRDERRGEDLDRGIQEAQQAKARSPHHPAPRALLASLYLWGDANGIPLLDRAAAELEEAIVLAKPFQAPQAYLELARAYLRLGRTEEAQSLYQRLLAAYPQGLQSPQPLGNELSPAALAAVLGEAHLKLGRFAFEGGNTAAAERHYRAAIALKAAAPEANLDGLSLGEAHHALGILALRRGDRAQAEAQYRSSLAADPQNPAAHYNLGLLYLETKRPQEALEQFQRSLALAPLRAATYFYRGLAYLELNERPLALQDLQQALRLDPTLREAAERLKELE